MFASKQNKLVARRSADMDVLYKLYLWAHQVLCKQINHCQSQLVLISKIYTELKLKSSKKRTNKQQLITCKSAVRPPLNTQGSWSPLIKVSFHPLENPVWVYNDSIRQFGTNKNACNLRKHRIEENKNDACAFTQHTDSIQFDSIATQCHIEQITL